MIEPVAYNSAQWQRLADDARAIAGQMKDPAARKTMMRVVEGYERLAERAKKHHRSPRTTEG